MAQDDELWRETLRGLNQEFYHQTVTSKQVEDYISRKLDIDLSAFFDQYLRTTKIPILEYAFDKRDLKFRYGNVVSEFSMPLEVTIGEEKHWITPTTVWQTVKVDRKVNTLEVAEDFYIQTREE